MDTPSNPNPRAPQAEPPARARARRAAVRQPLGERQRSRREAARRRIAARPRQPLSVEQRAFDPLGRTRRSGSQRTAYALAAILGSLGVHLAVVGVGAFWRSRMQNGAIHDEVSIQVRQRAPEPPPEKKPEPPVPVEKPTRPPPRIAKAPPPVAAPPPPVAAKTTPVRVVGLNLESTTEGGSGPAFAVGNTRQGETADHAVDPKSVKAAAPIAARAAATRVAAEVNNKAATNIPLAGIVRTAPKRRHPAKLPYPETLKSQGIEGAVLVNVTIDATGKVTKVDILKASPYPEFNEIARATALTEEFEPATRNGVPVEQSLSFTYRFNLEDGQ